MKKSTMSHSQTVDYCINKTYLTKDTRDYEEAIYLGQMCQTMLEKLHYIGPISIKLSELKDDTTSVETEQRDIDQIIDQPDRIDQIDLIDQIDIDEMKKNKRDNLSISEKKERILGKIHKLPDHLYKLKNQLITDLNRQNSQHSTYQLNIFINNINQVMINKKLPSIHDERTDLRSLYKYINTMSTKKYTYIKALWNMFKELNPGIFNVGETTYTINVENLRVFIIKYGRLPCESDDSELLQWYLSVDSSFRSRKGIMEDEKKRTEWINFKTNYVSVLPKI
jgi:hypothetical protein